MKNILFFFPKSSFGGKKKKKKKREEKKERKSGESNCFLSLCLIKIKEKKRKLIV